ncbi:hypothetical protein P170DRAFT_513591 [Aspergillus steynii IBT 23096]|uniref:DUF1308 domain-containing protein n=1 Tax=Aspergillus steynii IBT 23096 TaxID=1392250 RepID=A0A2I2FUS4_9EURO|nr:uncharacterized protein P170DRAFT_513591 [Aspergillus steynii IBT 23096]PLB44390.1 hypothetical protein P170DRAFT_513591 [Aspergillus steynii IBT 23096]
MPPTTDPDSDPSPSPAQLTSALITRCKTLLSELDALHALLAQTQRNPQVVEARSLRSSVLSELRTLEKLTDRVHAAGADADDDADTQKRLLHALRSSNLPFYETVWGIARNSCSGLVAFGKRFYWEGGNWEDKAKLKANDKAKDGDQGKGKGNGQKDKRRSVYVDIVTDDGEEWVKVSTISETRLLFEMAKKGWEADSEDGSEGEGDGGRTILQNFNDGAGHGSDGEEDDDDEIELVKLAGDMRKAANVTRVNYKHPRLRMVIPKIAEGKSAEIDNLLKVIRSYGVVVECGEGGLGSSSGEANPEDALAKDLRRLLPTPFKRFTPLLNVDCTLLLAIVSDVSYFKKIPPSPSLHRAILRQLEVESQRPLLTTELWPAMGAHELVCTTEAARRMREIVDVIGTDTEKKRAEIVMADPPFNDCDAKALIQSLQQLSDHEIPPHWQLPIRIVDANPVIDEARNKGQLPPVAHQVTEILSDINYSVFMYGWATGTTTISSNRTVVKQIEATVEKQRNGDEDLEGPQIWVCDTARSLVGKERGRKD